MGIHYENLDDTTRRYMLEESGMGNHYASPRLTPDGLHEWPNLLNEAISQHNDDWLADQLLQRRYIRGREEYTTRAGKPAVRNINGPHAALQLAEGEFNRYYLRGLCRRAIDENCGYLVVYRGKQVRDPRPASEAKIGTQIDPNDLLPVLRSNDFVSIEGYLAIPSGPNSGLTARLG